MSLAKEVLEALALSEGETVLRHWTCHHHICVLTNHRITLLSPHRVLGHPHHELNWHEKLENVRSVEIAAKTISPINEEDTAGPISPTGYVGRLRFMPSTATGFATVPIDAGNYSLEINNVLVYDGDSREAASIREAVEKASVDRKRELGLTE